MNSHQYVNYYSVLLAKVVEYDESEYQRNKYHVEVSYDGDYLNRKILNKGDYLVTNIKGETTVVSKFNLNNVAHPLPSAPDNVIKWIDYCKECNYNIFKSRSIDQISDKVLKWIDDHPDEYATIWLYGGNVDDRE